MGQSNLWKLKLWVRRTVVRCIPSIVWRRQQVEVGIHFDLARVELKDILEIERLLSKNNIHFDTGAGCGNRDWEWDYSLDGPVVVRFKRKRKE